MSAVLEQKDGGGIQVSRSGVVLREWGGQDPVPEAEMGELERMVIGELHLVRRRLDRTLDGLGALLRATGRFEEWEDVEQAARVAYRGLACALAAAPPLEERQARPGLVVVGFLRVDTRARRQWWGPVEFELSPLLHRLLARLAEEPYRVFAREELLREVWSPLLRSETRASAIPATIMRLRRVLVHAGAPEGRCVVTHPGVGWALLPSRVR